VQEVIFSEEKLAKIPAQLRGAKVIAGMGFAE
jgi:hypothetical protein